MASFELKKTYTFNTLAPAVLGEKYQVMRVRSIMDYDNALLKKDVTTEFQTLKPLIPSLPDNVRDLTFILFEDINGSDILFALEYINATTIKEVSAIDIRVEIRGVSSEDLSIIKTKLTEMGYSNLSVNSF